MTYPKKYLFIGNELSPIFKKTENVSQVLLEGNINDSFDVISKCDGIIILVETEQVFKGLISKTEVPTGISIAQQLRLKGFTKPILFTSHSSRSESYANKADREILNVIGHGFIQQPQSPDNFIELLDGIDSLDSLELYDIQNSCCRKDGIIRELSHRLSSKSNIGDKQLFIDAIQNIASVYEEDATIFISEFEKQYPQITEINISLAIADIAKYGETLIKQFSSVNSEGSFSDDANRKWKLLWLDDEAAQDHPLIKLLTSKGVQVYLCSSASLALDLLEDDWNSNNEIGVVLADYRLYEFQNEVKVQQPVQGYKLLSEIAQSGRMIRLAALSALPRKFLLHSFKHFNVRTAVYSKKDYLEDEITRKLLCEELIEMGDENQEAIISMPDDASGWKFLKQSYKQYRNSFDYLNNEKKITEKALANIYHFEQNNSLAEPIGFKKSNFNSDKNAIKNLEKFQPYWLARRIGLWLGVVKKLSNERIAEVLRGAPCTDYKQVISQYLGLRIEDFPLSLTVEEKNWFHYSLGIPVYRQIEITNSLLKKIESQFEKLLTGNTMFLTALKQNGCLVTIEKGNNKLVIQFSESGRPILKSYYAVKCLYRVLVHELKLSDDKILSFTRDLWVKVREHQKPSDTFRSINLLVAFFKREVSVLSNEPIISIGNSEREFIYESFKAIKSGKSITPKNDKEHHLISDLLIAYADYSSTEKNSEEDFIKKFAEEREQQKTKESQWNNVVNNSVTKKGSSKLDFIMTDEEY